MANTTHTAHTTPSHHTQPRTEASGATHPATKPVYAVFWLYRVDPAFHRLPEAQQSKSKAEFLTALDGRASSVTLRGSYSLVGLRGDADLLFWVWGDDLDAIQRLAVALRQSGLGRYLTQVETYVGVVAIPRYDPEHGPAFTSGVGPKNFVSVYPFVKTTEWYLLPHEERRNLMAEHGQVGRQYAVPRAKLLATAQNGAANGTTSGKGSHGATATATLAKTEVEAGEEGGGVLSNTVDAFALGDYEFILANESDDPDELRRMMLALRAVEVRRYTKLDTPIFLGRLRTPAEALADL
ncbi:MAG: chlorite dismutase family protein [Ktedonobacterales bacterium]